MPSTEHKEFELVQKGLGGLGLAALAAGAVVVAVGAAMTFASAVGLVFSADDRVLCAIIGGLVAIAGGRIAFVGLQQWRARDATLYIVRCSDGELAWGPTGTETRIALSRIRSAYRVDDAADFASTILVLDDGKTLEIGGVPFGQHQQLVAALVTVLNTRGA